MSDNNHAIVYLEDGRLVVSPMYGYREPIYELSQEAHVRGERRDWVGDTSPGPTQWERDAEDNNIGGLRLTHDNRKRPTAGAKAFAAIVLVCLSALVLAGTVVLLMLMIGTVV